MANPYSPFIQKALESLAFGAIALIPICLLSAANKAMRPRMSVTVYYTTPPGGSKTWTNVTAFANDGKVVKITGTNAAGEVETVNINWAFVIEIVQKNTG